VRPCDMLWCSVLPSRLRWFPRSKVSPEAGKKGDGGRVVEIGALDRCGDITKRRPGASRLFEGTKLERYKAGPTQSAVTFEPIRVLEYLTARISHLLSGIRGAT
jgi:hypothetical protein